MSHPSGKGVWRFVHRETGAHLDVIGHTANECMLENTAAFVVAFGALPDWSQFHEPKLLSDTCTVTAATRSVGTCGNDVHTPKQPKPKRRRAIQDAPEILRVVGPERERFLSGSGRA